MKVELKVTTFAILEGRKIYIYALLLMNSEVNSEMVLAFLIPLLTGLISGYLYQKSTDEIGYLAGGVAIISFIICLVMAPWEVQVLLLVAVLVSTQKLLGQNDYRIDTEGSASQESQDRRYKG